MFKVGDIAIVEDYDWDTKGIKSYIVLITKMYSLSSSENKTYYVNLKYITPCEMYEDSIGEMIPLVWLKKI